MVLMTPGRTGSSFVSSWFSKALEDRTMYFLEPCSASFQRVSQATDITGIVCADLLKEIFNCDWSRVSFASQVSTGDGFDSPWGNVTSLGDCGTDTRLMFIKEIRLGVPILSLIMNQKSPWGSIRPRIIAIDRDPRAVLASRKVVWAGWSDVIGRTIEQLDENNLAGSWQNRLDEAVNETQNFPFVLESQRGHPYTQSVRALCTEMLAARRIAEQTQSQEKPVPISFFLLDYERDVLLRPLETSSRLLSFVGLGDARNVKDVHNFITSYISGECDARNEAFSTCRNHSFALTSDSKWMSELSTLEKHLIERDPVCLELLQLQGRAPNVSENSAIAEKQLLQDARGHASELRKRALLHGSKLVVEFIVVSLEESSLVSKIGVYWVQRHPRGTGQPKGSNFRRIKSTALVGSIDGSKGGSLQIKTTHTHEFILLGVDEGGEMSWDSAFRERNGDTPGSALLHWVADASQGEFQKVTVNLEERARATAPDNRAGGTGFGVGREL